MPSSAHHPESPKRILMCISNLSQLVEMEIQRGIRRFALNQPDWDMGYLDVKDAHTNRFREALSWKPDGILMVARATLVPELLTLPGVPTVAIDLHHDQPPGIPRIEIDNHAVGRRAAEYFLKLRFEHLAVVTAPHNPPYSSRRAEGFSQTLLRKGRQPHTFQVQTISGKPWFQHPALNTWLDELPKPVGIYGVQDMVAQRIQEQCRNLNLHIPSEVSVLGTDNHPLLCEAFRPFLSSIPIPQEAAGFRAAELLNELLDLRAAGKPLPVVCELIEPGEVVERQSTSLRAIPDPAVARAAEYLHDHALTGGTIAEAARVAGINRRSLERKFKHHLGATPGEYIQEVKTDHAKRLLTETDLRMSDIAEACGMVQDHFSTFFRTATGLTPSAYRRKYSKPGG